MPAPTGMAFCSVIRRPCPCLPTASKKPRAAFAARLRSSPGMKEKLLLTWMRPVSVGRSSSSSQIETVCMTMHMS